MKKLENLARGSRRSGYRAFITPTWDPRNTITLGFAVGISSQASNLSFRKVILQLVDILYFYLHAGKPCLLFDETNLDWAPSVDLGHDSVRTVSVERYHTAE